MILINKVEPFTYESHQKELIECLLKNSGSSFISKIVIFYNNHNIVLPKNNKVNLVVKNGYSDREIIEYCKRIYNDDIFIFANPFISFNNTLIHVDQKLNNTIQSDDFYIFNRDVTFDTNQDSIEKMFVSTTENNKISIDKANVWQRESVQVSSRQRPIISEKNQKKIQNYLSKKELKDIPKIDVIIVSVNYNDTLPAVLSKIPREINISVVTTQSDTECQTICSKFDVNCIISNRIYENDASFNKGKAINDGIKSISNPDWILLLDADIYLKPDFIDVIKQTNLTPQDLFICKRLIIQDKNELNKWESGENVGVFEKAKGYGFFHLFNIKKFNKRPIFPESHSDASFSDLEFRDSFDNKKELSTYVIHLGEINQNWKGRKTRNFNTNLTYYIKNEWGVIDNFHVEQSKYGKFKIINSVNFDYHHGGWTKVLKDFRYINNEKGINFDCFLEKNFSWENSQRKIYTENWIGILHNPTNAPQDYLKKVKNIEILDCEEFKQSLFYCKGLYVFSNHEKIKVQNRLKQMNFDIPVNFLRHTTTPSKDKWSYSKYKTDRKIIHIGWWFRDISSFYNLRTKNKKIRIKLNDKIEKQIKEVFTIVNRDVEEIDYLSGNQYEKILTSSIVFLKLIDAVANNTILECIERCIPVVVNRHPSVEEYLGADYPLYINEGIDIDKLISDENLIKTSEYLSKITKNISLGKQIERSEIYRNIESEFNVQTIFEPSDLDNSEGGIYNPGFSKFRGKNYFITRVEKLTEKERGANDMWIKTTSEPHLSVLDDHFNVIKTDKLKVIGNYKRIEDFRLFTFNDKLYSNHIIIDENMKIYPVISEVDILKKTLSIIGKIEIDNQKIVEKNWTFFEKNKNLYLLYSINPFKVYEVNLNKLTSVLVQNKINELDWKIEGYLSSSTNPVEISDNKYVMGIHSRDNQSIYHQGFLIFDENFENIKSSKYPYLSGGDFDGIHTNVIYTSSLVEENGRLFCFAGDGDTKTISIEIKNDTLWKELL